MYQDNTTFAVVGFGRIGGRHAGIISRHPRTELLAICDIDPKKCEAAQAAHDVPVYPTLTEMLKSGPPAQVINICTPNGWHARQALEVLNNDRHVVIEKPMGLKYDECRQVSEAAAAHDRKVFCVMQNRYTPASAWLKELIDEERFGKVYLVKVNCFWNRDDRYYKPGGWHGSLEMDGGPLFTQFSHFFDLMVWLLGDVDGIEARFENYNHSHSTEFEDSGIVSFKFKSGALGSFNYSTSVWEQNFESSITIIGEKGTVKVGGQYMEQVEYCNLENYELPQLAPANPPNDYGPYKGSAANHHYIFENVINALQGTEPITTPVEEGMMLVRIIEEIYQSRKL